LDVLNGLLKIERSHIRPDKLALLGVNLNIRHIGIKSNARVAAYHVFIQTAVIVQGLLQYLAVVAPKLVWNSFGSWLRTIRPGIPPSELVVAQALRQTLPDFLLVSSKVCALAKFIADRQNTHKMTIFRLTA
jgi:hypothetical protein